MQIADILDQPSMPIASPSYPRGPYRFINREYLIVTYETDDGAIRQALPEPLQPDGSNTVMYEFIRMPDSSGFGDYTESGLVIPAIYQGEHLNFTAQMYLDDEPPISGGREIWGFPKKLGNPKLSVIHDTLTGVLEYAGTTVAVATMAYKHNNLAYDLNKALALDTQPLLTKLQKTQVNLKLIPTCTGQGFDVAQLVAYNLVDVKIKGAWTGAARLHLVPHVNAPVADFPIKKIMGGLHVVADLTLPYGRVLYDYMQQK